VLRVNLTVAMAMNVFMNHGHVMAMQTVLLVQMKQMNCAHQLHVKIKVFGIVAMANVFQHNMFVMDQVSSVTQAGLLTVLMAQMKA